jgi:hypothetical protein
MNDDTDKKEFTAKTVFKDLKGKLLLWLKAYLNEADRTTFLNATASARKAGYRAGSENSFAVIGYQNFIKLQSRVDSWLDEVGLSETYIKRKVKSLAEARQTSIYKIKGKVDQKDLPPNITILAEAGLPKWAGKGDDAEMFNDGDTLVAVEMEALETQRRTIEMAIKIKGMNAPDKVDHNHIVHHELDEQEHKFFKDMAVELGKLVRGKK